MTAWEFIDMVARMTLPNEKPEDWEDDAIESNLETLQALILQAREIASE